MVAFRMRTPPSAPRPSVAAALVHDPMTSASVQEEILVELEPEIAQRVGRMVVVGDPLLSAKGARRGIETRADHVVSPLLPIVGTRGAAAGADGGCGAGGFPAGERPRCPGLPPEAVGGCWAVAAERPPGAARPGVACVLHGKGIVAGAV